MMPPHCDTLDGPGVKAAKKAFETGNVNYVLPWVPKKAEKEVFSGIQKGVKSEKAEQGSG